jgi:hypothetical protein
MTRYLMKDAIKGSSVAIRAHQWRRCIHGRSVRAHQSSSELIRAHQSSSEVIRSHQSSSEAIRGHQRSSEVHQRSSERRYIHVLLAMRRFVHAHMGGDVLKRLFESFNACGRQALLFTLHPSARVAALVVA